MPAVAQGHRRHAYKALVPNMIYLKKFSSRGGYLPMAALNMRQRAQVVTRFTVVQLIALVGWIIVQSFFSLSPPGRTIPFAVTIVIEAIWWMATLVIMFLLFKRIYDGFVQTVLDLEEANKRLREATNSFLSELREQDDHEENLPTAD